MKKTDPIQKLYLSDGVPLGRISLILRNLGVEPNSLWYEDIKMQMIIVFYKYKEKPNRWKLKKAYRDGLNLLLSLNKGINKHIVNNEITDKMFYG